MTRRHLSLRIDAETVDRLDAVSQRTDRTRSELASRLIDEGLRMMEHPGIVFRDGPAGRRAGLAAGMDVWEVARVFTQLDLRGESLINQTAELTGLQPLDVRIALRYYAEYRQEIDDWISRIDAEAARAEAAWHRERAVLRE